MTVVSGQVRGHAGQGVPGVFVSAVPAGGRRFSVAPSTYTGRDGWWWLELTPGQWRIRETGFGSHDLLVGDESVDTTPEAMSQTATTPTAEDVTRLLSRRKREPSDEPEPAESSIARLMRRRRGE